MLMFDTEMNYVKTALLNLLHPTEKLDVGESRSIWKDGYEIITVCKGNNNETYAVIRWRENSYEDAIPIHIKLSSRPDDTRSNPTWFCTVSIFDPEQGEEVFSIEGRIDENLDDLDNFAYSVLISIHTALYAYNNSTRK